MLVAASCSSKSTKDERAFELKDRVTPGGADFARAMYQTLGTWMLPGVQIEVVNNGEVFDAIKREIDRAKSSVHILIYIWDDGEASKKVVEALERRAAAGVACRILVDAFGSSAFKDKLRDSLADKCDVRFFRPSHRDDDIRNHRKIVVVDGRVGITGGFGIRDDWLGDGLTPKHWRDTNAVVHGPAVAAMQQAFAENWQETTGHLLPADAFPAIGRAGTSTAALITSTQAPIVTRAERLTQLMIAAANKRLWISNAYFMPTDAVSRLLRDRADSGVDVRILTAGGSSDSKISFVSQRTSYRSYLEHGIRVWEFRTTMMHAKTMVVDDRLVEIGSVNLDPLSLNRLEEDALVAEDPKLAKMLAQQFEADLRSADEQK